MSHFPATRFLLQSRLMPTSHPSYLFLPSEPCTCLFWGSFASAGPPNSFSGVLRLIFLNPNPCTCLGKCASTFSVVPRLFFFCIKPLPSLKEAFSEVRREESRKKVMMGSKSNLPQHWMALPLLLGQLIVVVEIVRKIGRAHV